MSQRSGAPSRRAIVPAVATTLAVGIGGAAFALAGAGPATSAPPAPASAASSSGAHRSVDGLIAGTYDADFARLSVPGGGEIRCPKPPQLPGAAHVGDVLRIAPGTFKPAAVSVSYQWYVGTKAIRGADGTSYRPDVDDLGKKITVVTIATKKGYRTERVVTVVGQVKPGDLDATSRPRIEGAARVGSTLSVAGVDWSESGVQSSYTWYAGRKVVGLGKRHQVTRAERGDVLRVEVTGSKKGFADAVVSATSGRVRG